MSEPEPFWFCPRCGDSFDLDKNTCLTCFPRSCKELEQQKLDNLKDSVIVALRQVTSGIGVHPEQWNDLSHPENSYTHRTPEQDAWNEKVLALFKTLVNLDSFVK